MECNVFNYDMYPNINILSSPQPLHHQSQLRLIGQLQLKEIGKQIITLTEECEVYIIEQDANIKQQFMYELRVVNTEYEDNKDTWNNLSFPVSSESMFKLMETNGISCLIWERNRHFYIFEILIDQQNKKNKSSFLEYLSSCIVSADFQMSLEDAKSEECLNYVIINNGVVDNVDKYFEDNYAHYNKQTSNDNNDIDIQLNELNDDLIQMNTLSYRKVSSKINKQTTRCILSSNGLLFNYIEETDSVNKVFDGQCRLCIYLNDNRNYRYILTVESGDDMLIIFDYISNQFQYDSSDKEIMWITSDTENTQLRSKALSFFFENKNDVNTLKEILTKCNNESLYDIYQEEHEREHEHDNTWINNSLSSFSKDFIIFNDDNNIDDDDEVDLNDEFTETPSVNTNNKFTTQAYIHDRTFSIKDDNTITVYKTNDTNGTLTALMSLPAVKHYNTTTDISLKNGQMFLSDTNMLFLDTMNPNVIYQYDIPSAKIVSEWEVNTGTSHNEILSISLQTKMGQMNNDPIVYGVNNHNIFAMDSRLNKKNKLTEIKSYKTNPLMQCIASTKQGYFVIGSNNGEIRLFDSVGTNAKNLLQCYGDAIRGVDVTVDGRFVLATCDRYLLLIKTEDNKGKNLFTHRAGKVKPTPITLKVKAFDLERFRISKAKYTPAKFNVNANGESIIITSLSEYVVVWNFNKIKKGVYDCYKIKQVGQYVIDNHFKYNKAQIVVTMNNKLGLQNQLSSHHKSII